MRNLDIQDSREKLDIYAQAGLLDVAQPSISGHLGPGADVPATAPAGDEPEAGTGAAMEQGVD